MGLMVHKCSQGRGILFEHHPSGIAKELFGMGWMSGTRAGSRFFIIVLYFVAFIAYSAHAQPDVGVISIPGMM
ncbi:MAG: hypothetical protein HC902_02540 [Calothrix sp. SM1_5_4]|nr:hypothetical protein [Calothrix sp. SM1_5_4]